MSIVEKLRVKEKCKKENNDRPNFWALPVLSFNSMFSFLPSRLQLLSLSALAPFSQPINVVSSPPSQRSHHYGGVTAPTTDGSLWFNEVIQVNAWNSTHHRLNTIKLLFLNYFETNKQENFLLSPVLAFFPPSLGSLTSADPILFSASYD